MITDFLVLEILTSLQLSTTFDNTIIKMQSLITIIAFLGALAMASPVHWPPSVPVTTDTPKHHSELYANPSDLGDGFPDPHPSKSSLLLPVSL